MPTAIIKQDAWMIDAVACYTIGVTSSFFMDDPAFMVWHISWVAVWVIAATNHSL